MSDIASDDMLRPKSWRVPGSRAHVYFVTAAKELGQRINENFEVVNHPDRQPNVYFTRTESVATVPGYLSLCNMPALLVSAFTM